VNPKNQDSLTNNTEVQLTVQIRTRDCTQFIQFEQPEGNKKYSQSAVILKDKLFGTINGTMRIETRTI
jgi:hypothetical protein